VSPRVQQILSYYPADNAGTKASLGRLLRQGRLAGSGRLVILPVDQGVEHGPHRSFAVNPPAYDPEYHARFALEAGMSGYAAPLGFIEAVADYAPHLPLILKLNNHDLLYESEDPMPAVTGSVEAAVRLGCVGIGYTIYPGSAHRVEMYERLQYLAEEAKEAGLAVVVWSYPRGSGIGDSKGETALDVIAYAAQLACQMGAHLVKVKLPSDHLHQAAARKVYEAQEVPRATTAERVRHVTQAAFAGKRIVIFSGGSKASGEAFFDDIRGIRDGGGYGSIIGRNSFQRPWDEALQFIRTVIDIYLDEA
jgi:class I fructose-bisphosphate aldolase